MDVGGCSQGSHWAQTSCEDARALGPNTRGYRGTSQRLCLERRAYPARDSVEIIADALHP